MTNEKMTETKLSEEDYKLAEEVIKPIYHNAIKNDFSFAKYGVECYLAGLKAGRPKWHKVADGDLPKEDKSIMIYAKLADGVAVGKRRKQGKVYEWYFATYDGTFCLRDKEVIAWCEIPQYTEE